MTTASVRAGAAVAQPAALQRELVLVLATLLAMPIPSLCGAAGGLSRVARAGPVNLEKGVAEISCGGFACAVRFEDGSANVWGYHKHGGDLTDTPSGKAVNLQKGVVQVNCGGSVCAARFGDGSAVAWGSQHSGGDTTGVDLQKNVVDITCGNALCAARFRDGSATVWGAKDTSRAVYGSDTTGVNLQKDVVEINCGWSACAARFVDGSATAWGNKDYGGDLTGVNLEKDVVEINCGSTCYARFRNGSATVWGNKDYGGDLTGVNLEKDVAEISCGHYACAARFGDGSATAWGHKSYGGDPTGVDLTNVVGISCGGAYRTGACAAWFRDGSATVWGHEGTGGNHRLTDSGRTVDLTGVNLRVVQVSCGAYSCAARFAGGSGTVWGHQDYGGDLSDVVSHTTLAPTTHVDCGSKFGNNRCTPKYTQANRGSCASLCSSANNCPGYGWIDYGGWGHCFIYGQGNANGCVKNGQVCFKTSASSPTPPPTTAEPTPKPTDSKSTRTPTNLPTAAETLAPTTQAEPTVTPSPTTAEPTPKPTNSKSTRTPTQLPTVAETLAPTTHAGTATATAINPVNTPTVEATINPASTPTVEGLKIKLKVSFNGVVDLTAMTQGEKDEFAAKLTIALLAASPDLTAADIEAIVLRAMARRSRARRAANDTELVVDLQLPATMNQTRAAAIVADINKAIANGAFTVAPFQVGGQTITLMAAAAVLESTATTNPVSTSTIEATTATEVPTTNGRSFAGDATGEATTATEVPPTNGQSVAGDATGQQDTPTPSTRTRPATPTVPTAADSSSNDDSSSATPVIIVVCWSPWSMFALLLFLFAASTAVA